jgi:hypothetical protein
MPSEGVDSQTFFLGVAIFYLLKNFKYLWLKLIARLGRNCCPVLDGIQGKDCEIRTIAMFR